VNIFLLQKTNVKQQQNFNYFKIFVKISKNTIGLYYLIIIMNLTKPENTDNELLNDLLENNIVENISAF
jgi:hypothetical protein